jgi:hypothetical protein
MVIHGAPPDVRQPEDINDVQICSEQWFQLTWGDFVDKPGDFIGENSGRPVFGIDYFKRVMKQLGAQVLIRSHQTNIDPVIFDKRCLTLMTSYYYTMTRTVAIADLERPAITSVDDLEIVEIK